MRANQTPLMKPRQLRFLSHQMAQRSATSSHKEGGQNSRIKGKYREYYKRPHHTIETSWKLHRKPNDKERREKEFTASQVLAQGIDWAHQTITQ